MPEELIRDEVAWQIFGQEKSAKGDVGTFSVLAVL